MRPVAGMHPHHVSDRRELPRVLVGPAQHLAPVGGQSFGVLRMQTRMTERMLGLGVGEAALVPRVGESEHRGGAAGGLVDTLTGRHGHRKNAIARELGATATVVQRRRPNNPRFGRSSAYAARVMSSGSIVATLAGPS